MTTTSTSRPSSSSGAPGIGLPGTDARVLVTSRSAGDASPWRATGGSGAGLGLDHRSLVDRPWTFVRQVHGCAVAVVEEATGPLAADADAIVTRSERACVAVLGADCALVGLASPDGVVAVAHAGWRGLVAGVLGRTVEAMRSLGATDVVAVLGPCAHAPCYEFGEEDLERVAEHLGPSVRAVTAAGSPALDLVEGVRLALDDAGARLVGDLEADPGGCTVCDGRWFSHRARADAGRHALAVWREPTGRRS